MQTANTATTSTANETSDVAPKRNDSIEAFIERLIADAKTRPFVANLGVAFMGFGLLSSRSFLPSAWASYSEIHALGEPRLADTMMIVSAISFGSFTAHMAAVHGLYKMRRYGVYGVGATALLSAALIPVAGLGAIGGMLIPSALFYFLWNDREKFA